MRNTNLRIAYIAVNELLDTIDLQLNSLSETFAGFQRAVISNPDNYTPIPESKDMDNLIKLYDFLLSQYTGSDKGCFKNYIQYHSLSAINHIFKTPENSMDLSPLVECLTSEAKKELENLDQLYNILDSTIHNLVNDKIYTFACDNELPKRITPDQLISTGIGLP